METTNQTSNINVACRIRPPLPREINDGEFYESVVPGQKSNNQKQDVFVSITDEPCIIPKNYNVTEKPIEGIAKYSLNQVYDQNTTQQQLFQDIAQNNIEPVLQGINSAIFAYGQTGTGKSYTIFGDERDYADQGKQGIVPRTIQYLFNKQQEFTNNSQQLQVYMSILQIYNEQLSDLLNFDKKSQDQIKLEIRENKDKQKYVKNLTNIEIQTLQQTMQLIQKAYQNRYVKSTNMNEASSRSHIILTFTVNIIQQQQQDQEIQVLSSKLNLVDLAGSEKVKLSGATGQTFKEACHINKSLFNFQNVMVALEKKEKPNYRDTKLTTILQDSLGGNCKTTMIACVSPSKQFSKGSNSTLMLAHRCKNIQSVVKPNKYKGNIPSYIPIKIKKKQEVEQFQWNDTEFSQYQTTKEKINLQNFQGIHILKLVNQQLQENNNIKNIIFIHGCTQQSNSQEFQHFFKLFQFLNFNIYSIDMPGYGKSQGKTQSFRTREILLQNGPAQVIEEVIQHYNLNNHVVIMGYDWGGAISLRLGVKYSQKQNPEINIKHIISFMPAYGEHESYKDELKKLTIPTQLLWVKKDQLHNWQKFKNKGQKIPNVEISMVNIQKWTVEISEDLYSKESDKLCKEIYQFLEKDNLQKLQIQKQVKNVVQTTHNQQVNQVKQIVFKEDLDIENIKNLTEQITQQEAIQYFIKNHNFNVNKFLKQHKNNTLPQQMQQNYFFDKLNSQFPDTNINYQKKEFLDHLSVIKIYLKLQLQIKPYNTDNIIPDNIYYQQFLDQNKNIQENYLQTQYGIIHYYLLINPEFNNYIFAMHGDGATSSNLGWLPVMEQFHKLKFNFISISMPGYGKSTGNQADFRAHGKEILLLIIRNFIQNPLSKNKAFIMGRSVGGRTSIEFANKYPQYTEALILQHPVVPNDDIIYSCKNMPIVLSWAKDDGEWDKARDKPNAGHPYFGPHGAVHIKKLTNCQLINWNEYDYEMGYRGFYEQNFVPEVYNSLRKIVPSLQ